MPDDTKSGRASVRLRYGNGLRARFLIRTLDEPTAKRREAKLCEARP